MIIRLLLPILMLMAVPASGQETSALEFGGDLFAGGSEIVADADHSGDVFLAGDSVRLEGATAGSAHTVGRRVAIMAAVGGNLYAFGMDVSVSAPIAGNATMAGYDVQLQSTVSGNVRATGATVRMSGEIGGSAIVAGEDVTISGKIMGDLLLTGENIEFSPNAEILGMLKLYADDPDAIDIPAAVIAEDRISREKTENWEYDAASEIGRQGFFSVLWGLLGTVIATTIMAVLFAAVAPNPLALLRENALAQPFRSIWLGFLGHSVLIGGAIVLALTLVAIFVSPALLLAAGLMALIGYVVGSYAIGVGLLSIASRPTPEVLSDRALAALVGAIAAGIITMIPFFGWLFWLVLVMMGSGSVITWLFRPKFFAD